MVRLGGGLARVAGLICPRFRVQDVCRHATFERVLRGRILFRQGEPGASFFVCLYGTVMVWANLTSRELNLTPAELRAAAAREHLVSASDAQEAQKRAIKQARIDVQQRILLDNKCGAGAVVGSLTA